MFARAAVNNFVGHEFVVIKVTATALSETRCVFSVYETPAVLEITVVIFDKFTIQVIAYGIIQVFISFSSVSDCK